MAIDRDGKHWCEPAAETPDENGLFYCQCGTVWTYDAAERLWSPYVAPDPEPGTGEEPIAAAAAAEPAASATSPAATKRKTRTGKGGAE
jgi:hypothetical protein